MDKFDPSFIVILVSLAGVICAKRIVEGNPAEVPLFYQSIKGRLLNSTLGFFLLGAFITAFAEGFIHVAWWFPFLLYFLAAIIVNFLPYMRMHHKSKTYSPAVGLLVYSTLTFISLLWLISRW